MNFFVCLFIFIVFISLLSLLASLPFVSTIDPQTERGEVLAIPVLPVIINSVTIARSARHVLLNPIQTNFRPDLFLLVAIEVGGGEAPVFNFKTANGTDTKITQNKTPKVVSVGCVGLWKHNGVLSRLMEQNKTKHPLASSRVEPRVTKFDKVPMF